MCVCVCSCVCPSTYPMVCVYLHPCVFLYMQLSLNTCPWVFVCLCAFLVCPCAHNVSVLYTHMCSCVHIWVQGYFYMFVVSYMCAHVSYVFQCIYICSYVYVHSVHPVWGMFPCACMCVPLYMCVYITCT